VPALVPGPPPERVPAVRAVARAGRPAGVVEPPLQPGPAYHAAVTTGAGGAGITMQYNVKGPNPVPNRRL
jgi:hypothetical protein